MLRNPITSVKFSKFLIYFIAFFILTAISPTTKKIVFLGDSLTEGYGVAKDSAFPALLEKTINKIAGVQIQVINAGVSGSTTASALSRLKWLKKQNPDLIFLILGANDGLRGLKLQDSEKNLASAIEFCQKEKIQILLGGLYMPPNYGKEYTEKFKKMYSSLAEKFKVPLVPFILDKVAGNSKLNLADGIHPNEEGHKIIAETIYESLRKNTTGLFPK